MATGARQTHHAASNSLNTYMPLCKQIHQLLFFSIFDRVTTQWVFATCHENWSFKDYKVKRVVNFLKVFSPFFQLLIAFVFERCYPNRVAWPCQNKSLFDQNVIWWHFLVSIMLRICAQMKTESERSQIFPCHSNLLFLFCQSLLGLFHLQAPTQNYFFTNHIENWILCVCSSFEAPLFAFFIITTTYGSLH